MENKRSVTQRDVAKLGKAGEHLVCSDLLIKGYDCFISPDGSSRYDVILDTGKQMLKVQVKTTLKPRYGYTKKKMAEMSNFKKTYSFNVYTRGETKNTIYDACDVDIFALVSMDMKHVAYIPYTARAGNVNFRCPQNRWHHMNERGLILHPKIVELQKSGLSRKEICAQLNITNNTYADYKDHRYLSKGPCAGVYIDEFPIEKCLVFIDENKNNCKDAIMLKRFFHPHLFANNLIYGNKTQVRLRKVGY